MDDGAPSTRTPTEELAIEQERASLALNVARMGEFEWRVDEDLIIISERMSAIIGVPAGAESAAGGALMSRNVHPDDVEAFRRAANESLEKNDRGPFEFRLIRPDNGKVLWLSGSVVGLRGPNGQLQRVIGVLQDINERKAREHQLAIEQERASLALTAARMGEFEWDIEEDRLIISERMAAITGLPAGSMPAEVGQVSYRFVHPDDREALSRAVTDGLIRDQRYEVRYRMIRPDNGKVLWMSSAAVALRDASGVPRRVIGVVEDISERKAEEDAREALVAELDHRVKNVLASVQSLAAQSARKTTSVDTFLKTFAGRLEAMASAHTLLTTTRWRGAQIGHIAAAELGGLAPGQAVWSGPEIVLNPRATNALTLALHELATNAVKYGALSTETGRVEVKWKPRAQGGFELVWVERGGPSVSAPTRRGFGSTLLERVTGRELGGEARMEFRPDGVRATICADASSLAASPSDETSPAAPEPAEPALPAHDGASSGVSPVDGVKGRRILIVEDAVLLALELEAGLTEAGAQVVGTAADIEEALRLIDTSFDVAVLDANLNGVSVTPVAEALSARGKAFIIATGYGDAGPAPEGFDVPVVRKPYNVNQIAAAIAEALAAGVKA
ncbi:MAG: PAS domain-containing protein [Caulobacterales bacterium]